MPPIRVGRISVCRWRHERPAAA